MSPTLFNVYSISVVTKWKKLATSGVHMSWDMYLNIVLFADDIFVIENKESVLYESVFIKNVNSANKTV